MIVRVVLTIGLLAPLHFEAQESARFQSLYSGIVMEKIFFFIMFIFFLIILTDIFSVYKFRKIYLFLPTAIGIIFIYQTNQIRQSLNEKLHEPDWIVVKSNLVEYETTNYTYRLELKKSRNFVLYETVDDGLASYMYYGTYRKLDSIVYLDSQVGSKGLSNRYVIRNDKEFIQLDSLLNEKHSKFRFKIK